MHYKNRGVGSGGVDLLQSWHAPFLKLKLGPATYHPDPLRRWRPSGLVLKHGESFRERGHSIPAQLHVVVETTADGMHVGIVQTRNYGSFAPVNNARLWASEAQDLIILACSRDFSCGYGDRFDKRGRPVRGDVRVMQVDCEAEETPPSGFYLSAATAMGTTYSGNFVAGAPCTMVYAYSTPIP